MIAEWPLVPSDTNLGMTMLRSTLALESHTSDDCKLAFPLIAILQIFPLLQSHSS